MRRLIVLLDLEDVRQRSGWRPLAGDRIDEFEVSTTEFGVSLRGPILRVTLEKLIEHERPDGAEDLVEIQKALGPLFDECEKRRWRVNGVAVNLEPAS